MPNPLQLRRKQVLAIGLIAAALAGVAAWRYGIAPPTDAYAAVRGDLVQTVVVSGRVESPRRVDIGSPVTGTVVEIPVVEGQHVKAGQLLVRLDEDEARAAVEQARSAVAQADARLAQLRATSGPVAEEALRQAQTNLANAQKSLARTGELFARGFVGQAALDDAQRTRDLADSQAHSARLQRDSAQPGGSDFRLAEAAAAQARAALRAAEAHLALLTIEAPSEGVLIARNIEKGNVAQPGKALMVLSPAGATQLVVQVDEKNLNLLKVGQRALASADAYPGGRFDATLAYINPGVDAMRGSIEVKLDVPNPPPYLLQDMTVSVDIEGARKSGVLSLPAEAVRDAATAKPWVLVVHDGRAERREVTLGARGDSMVEIAGGLAEGDLAIPATQGGIREGKAVRNARAVKRTGTT
jgi:HlyD family secretion protein